MARKALVAKNAPGGGRRVLVCKGSRTCYLPKVRILASRLGAASGKKFGGKRNFLFFPCKPLKSHKMAKEILAESKKILARCKEIVGETKRNLGKGQSRRRARPAPGHDDIVDVFIQNAFGLTGRDDVFAAPFGAQLAFF